jgi:hypothetical protein
VDYPQFLRITSDMSERALAPETVYESQARHQREHVLFSGAHEHR